jgi:hypothetical protein
MHGTGIMQPYSHENLKLNLSSRKYVVFVVLKILGIIMFILFGYGTITVCAIVS